MAALKRKASIYTFVILLTLCSLFLVDVSFPKVLSAETIYVNGSNVDDPLENGSLEHPYNTIQEGVNAASVGDTVQVASGTYYENVVINKSLTLKGAGSDITIIDGSGPPKTGVEITEDNVNISRFTIRNSGHGVHLHMCSGATVSDNTMTSNKYEGIYVQASNDNTIRGNIITSNKFEGMYLETSTGNKISGNTITNNTFWGICLDSSSNNNTISGNTITSHIRWPGISLVNSGSIIISDNMILSNDRGIELVSSSGDTISGNTISNNDLGIELYYSGGNTIYHNNFINNTDQVVPSGANAWNSSAEGNCWSDYNGTDLNGDGIGDTPYVINEYNKDNYPLMNPYDKTNPVADAGPDQLVVNGTTVTFDGNGSTDNLDVVNYGIVNYMWTFTDNTTQVLTDVKANYTFYNIGNFSVTLNVSDYSGNWDTDKMWVNVTETIVIRDVAITNITVSPTTVTTGEPIIVNVTVANEGNMSETFSVIVYYESSVVGTKNVASLASGDNETLSFNWATTGVPGGNYTVKAVAGIVDGETDTSDNMLTDGTVTIEKVVSTISISVSPANITVGAGTTINGSISPIRVEVNVTIHYRLSGENWSALKTVTTDADGRCSYDWTPTTAGTYEVKSSWEGDLTHLPDESDVVVVTVNMASSTILITVSPASVTVGSNITISGAISPVRAGVSVMIEGRPSGGNWTTLATVTTDSEGEYSYNWTTTEPGTYEVKTRWEGDDNTLADESDVEAVTVKEPATNIYLYAAAIAVIIIVSATVVYILRVRKPKPARKTSN